VSSAARSATSSSGSWAKISPSISPGLTGTTSTPPARLEQDVHRHDHAAGPQDAVVDRREVRDVGQHDPDAVAGADALALEHRRDTRAGLVEQPVVEGGVVELAGDDVRVLGRGSREVQGEVMGHGANLIHRPPRPYGFADSNERDDLVLMPQLLHVNRDVAIPLEEIVVRASRSSGPGGQHANVTASRIEVSFDVAASEALDEAQKRRITARCGPVVRAIAQDARSQTRNRALALERLAARLAGALEIPRTRRPTKPTHASRQRRLEAKRRGAERKRGRRRPAHDD
jgi:ribosome-associated protein